MDNPESVADHMYRMSIITLLASKDLDRDKCVRLAIVHDLAESIVGDITPSDGITDDEKHKREARAMSEIKAMLGDTPIGKELVALWKEYEGANSPNATAEAKFVKDVDKFEMILQADEYEIDSKENGESPPKDLSCFFESTKGKFRHPQIIDWVNTLVSQRDQRKEKLRY